MLRLPPGEGRVAAGIVVHGTSGVQTGGPAAYARTLTQAGFAMHRSRLCTSHEFFRLDGPPPVILIGIGASLPTPDGRLPRETCRAAVAALDALPGLRLRALSRWWESAPIPPMPGAPWFVNGVARLSGEAEPAALLAALHAIEAAHHRERPYPNAPRTLDLDLLDCNGLRAGTPALTLPHPRIAERGFVLHPLAEVAPDWRHPVTRETVSTLLRRLPAQDIRPFGEAAIAAPLPATA